MQSKIINNNYGSCNSTVMFFANFYFNQTSQNKNDVNATCFTPYQDMILTLGEAIESENLLFNGMTAYNNKDYILSSELLEQYRINN